MTSDRDRQAFVWIWLPNETEPVVAGRLEADNNFLLSEKDARTIFDNLTETIEQQWDGVCDEAGLSEVDKRMLWKRQFLNPFSIQVG